MNDMIASNQWANRPSDERFWDLDELLAATQEMKRKSFIHHTPESEMRIEAADDQLLFRGVHNFATLTHYAFGQLARRIQAPADFLRKLPRTLASQVMNNQLKAESIRGKDARLLLSKDADGRHTLRSVATTKFTPIWNADIVERLMSLKGEWRPPPGYVPWNADEDEFRTRLATAEDAALSLTIREGDTIAPAGLYASPEDMFIFLVSPEHTIQDGSQDGLMRGFIVQNAEVSGKLSFKARSFMFRGACGNHILWGLKESREIAVRHVGEAPEKAFEELNVTVNEYAESSTGEVEQRIREARVTRLGTTKDEVVNAVFRMSGIDLSKKALEASYDLATRFDDIDGDPKTFWGLANGITRYSQTLGHIDARTAVDREAGKLLEYF